jgi:predicted lipoprotein
MIDPVRRLALPLICCTLLLTACGGESAPITPPVAAPAGFDRTALMQRIVDEIALPGTDQFVATAGALDAAAQIFVTAPDEKALDAVRSAWRAASAAWHRLDVFSGRELMTVRSRINKWPPNPMMIERLLQAHSPITQEQVAGAGSTQKGLATLATLLFPAPGNPDTVLTTLAGADNAQLRAYLTALTADLVIAANDYQRVWTTASEVDPGRGYAATLIATAHGTGMTADAVGMLLNDMVEMLEGILAEKLAAPLGKSTGGDGSPDPALVEAAGSGEAIAAMGASLSGLQAVFRAGYDDYLDSLGADDAGGAPLSAAIDAQITASMTALQAIDRPLEEAVRTETAQIEGAYDAIKSLLVLIKVDMANKLGITITFSDADGD